MKLTKQKLNELIQGEIDKMRLDELYGTGLASSRPSRRIAAAAPQQKQKKKVYRHCKSMDDVPTAFGQNPDEEVICLIDENFDSRTDEERQADKRMLSITTFQRFYRELDDLTRFQFKKWLRKALIKELTFDEVNELVAKATASSKGNIAPEDKNKKPI
jgi:hypothetical protein